ncbi:hypothetical protein CSUI_008320 [Cystoisospora suis]|uniref:Transmembrane protein n=1 Tax=Cystoisospora suis TaxID=483139 RepID=A0A2C6KN87_9APIC|nr:hypothetical protein CSUI_008320 [Cystoisospora suis]
MSDRKKWRSGGFEMPGMLTRFFYFGVYGCAAAAILLGLLKLSSVHAYSYPQQNLFSEFIPSVLRVKIMRFPKSSPFGWLAAGQRRKATQAGKNLQEEKEDFTKKKAGEGQAKGSKPRQLPSSSAGGCFSSCLPRCLRFGKRKRATEAKASPSQEEERDEEKEASTCLHRSDVSRVTPRQPGVTSPLPKSMESPAFDRLFALGGLLVSEDKKGEDEAAGLSCLDKDDDCSSVEEVERDRRDDFNGKEESYDGEEVMEWLVHMDANGIVTAGVSRTCRGERTAIVFMYYAEEDGAGATWREEAPPECAAEHIQEKNYVMLMDDVETCQPECLSVGKFIGPAVPLPPLCEDASKGSPGVPQSSVAFKSCWSPFSDAGRVRFFASLLFKSSREEQLQGFAPNRSGATRFLAALGELLDKENKDEKQAILPAMEIMRGQEEPRDSDKEEVEVSEARSSRKETKGLVGGLGRLTGVERYGPQTKWPVTKKKKRKKVTAINKDNDRGRVTTRFEVPLQWKPPSHSSLLLLLPPSLLVGGARPRNSKDFVENGLSTFLSSRVAGWLYWKERHDSSRSAVGEKTSAGRAAAADPAAEEQEAGKLEKLGGVLLFARV